MGKDERLLLKFEIKFSPVGGSVTQPFVLRVFFSTSVVA